MKKMDLPPRTIEEFLQAQNLEDWPKSTHLEYDSYKSSLIIKKLKDACSLDEIHTFLCDNVPTIHKALIDMELRMKDLFAAFEEHASQILNYPQISTLTSYDKKLEKLKKIIDKFNKKPVFLYPYGSIEMKTVENCNFSGFKVNEPSRLPRHLEASEIYLSVLKSKKLDVKIFKIWLPLLFSKASINLLKDAFWWWFLHTYKPSRQDEDLLFDRISENYVLLIMKVPTNRKDAFLKVYPDYLSQAIYTAFQESCPDSSHLFNDAFKEELTMTIFQWLTGLTAPREIWSRWNLGTLEESTIHGNLKEPPKTKKELLKLRKITSKDMEFDINKLILSSQNILATSSEQEINILPKIESQNIGFGPEFCRILLKIGGQSPLVAYYLKVHEIKRNPKLPYFYKLNLTHVFRWPPKEGQTFREVAIESRKTFAKNRDALKIVSSHFREEMKELQMKQMEIDKKFQRMKNKAQWRPEEAMNDCEKYLEKLRTVKSNKALPTRSPAAVAAAAMNSIPAFASLPLVTLGFNSDDEEESEDPQQ